MAGEDDTYVQETLIKMCETVAADVQRPLDPSSTLAELGLDSLACADLALAVEDQFGVRLADADVTSLNTVRQIARVVKGKITSRSRIPPGLGRLQRPVVVLGGWAFRWQSRLEIHGAGHMPMRGPVLIAANHRSLLDTPLVALACPRPITFMAKQELFSNRF